jgi:hypothetical protein
MLKRAPSYEVKIAAQESAQVKTYAMSGFAETSVLLPTLTLGKLPPPKAFCTVPV